jgi:hypothetical protein
MWRSFGPFGWALAELLHAKAGFPTSASVNHDGYTHVPQPDVAPVGLTRIDVAMALREKQQIASHRMELRGPTSSLTAH